MAVHVRRRLLDGVPKGVDPASAIQQAKFSATMQWAAEFVMPHHGASGGDRS